MTVTDSTHASTTSNDKQDLRVSSYFQTHITTRQQPAKIHDHTMVMRNIHPSEASIVYVIVDPLLRDKVKLH